MPNRLIKESICSSESIDSLSWFEEVFFYRLTVNCDDYGRMDARPAILKSRLFPLKDITLKQIEAALSKLSTVGMVQVYKYDQKPFLQLVSWAKHQTVRNKRSKYPEPPELEINCMQVQANVPVIQSLSESNPIISSSEPPKQKKEIITQFWESVWKLYPNKKGKGQVSDTQKAKLFKIGLEELSRCIARYEKTKPSWQDYQNGSTFFNSGYVDYLDSNFQESPDSSGDDSKWGYLP